MAWAKARPGQAKAKDLGLGLEFSGHLKPGQSHGFQVKPSQHITLVQKTVHFCFLAPSHSIYHIHSPPFPSEHKEHTHRHVLHVSQPSHDEQQKWTVFGTFLLFGPFPSIQTCQMCPYGHVWHVWGYYHLSSPYSHPLNTKNMPLWAHFWHFHTSSQWDATNQPHMGSVHCVSSILPSNNQHHAQTGTVLVSLPSLKGGVSPEHQNTPFQAHFNVWPPFTTKNVPKIAHFHW